MEFIVTEFAGGALGKLGQMVVEPIANEASPFCNFSKDFKWLEKKGKQISRFLQDADTKNTNNESAKQWIRDVQDIAFQAEDILEEYEVESLYRSRSQYCWCSPSEFVFHYKMGRMIRDIKGRMSSLVADAQQMNLLYAASSLQQQPASTSTSQTEAWRKSSVMEWDSRPVAIDEKVKHILSLLTDSSFSVTAVVGMGGVGKTFLLQHVYSKAQSMFQNSIWLSISQSYSIRQLQRDLASKINLSNEVVQNDVSETRAQELIHERLRGTRSLIVLDDVWRATQEDDLLTKLGLPVGNKSECKVIVTTRSREVCSFMNAHFYQMECLSEEDSWRLFCAYAFSDTPQNTPPEHLKQVAREIAKECANLPLAIKTVASSMAHTIFLREWKKKLHQLKEVMEGNPNDPIIKIIKLSYDRLSTCVKPCFSYFSFFPEDEEINCEYLVHLWMAEGFIPDADVGWDYLRQFANLCLVEVRETHQTISCKLHDLVLDLAVSISKENRCVFKIENVFRRESGCLRVLLGKQGLRGDAIADYNFSCLPFVRTLALFKNFSLENIPPKLFRQLRVLRVLDLSHTDISSLPESVGNLKLLRVLNLCGTNITQVPECVVKLKSLRFLDVSHCQELAELPAWIGELTCLQYLNIRGFPRAPMNPILPKGISKLLSLQTLRSSYLKLSIEENDNELLQLEDLANMTELRELWIQVNHVVQTRRLEGILERLVHMRIFGINNKTPGEAEKMPFPFAETMKDLEQLFLFRFALPSWTHNFANLKFLCLGDCDYSDNSALALGTMSNLTKLVLIRNNRYRELPKAFGKSGTFPKLRFLSIWQFYVLEKLEFEDGAMAGLEKLEIVNCPEINNVPQGLERLKSLKIFEFESSGTEEVRDSLREGGEE